VTAEPGIYNVVDDDPLSISEWLPAFASWVDAPEPSRVSVEEALKTVGEEAVYYHTKLTGASNSRAKAKLGFAPRPLLWKRPARVKAVPSTMPQRGCRDRVNTMSNHTYQALP
jgi:2-alkyl-3-oxoalkanoate reductase